MGRSLARAREEVGSGRAIRAFRSGRTRPGQLRVREPRTRTERVGASAVCSGPVGSCGSIRESSWHSRTLRQPPEPHRHRSLHGRMSFHRERSSPRRQTTRSSGTFSCSASFSGSSESAPGHFLPYEMLRVNGRVSAVESPPWNTGVLMGIRRIAFLASVLVLLAPILAADPAAPGVAGDWQLDVGGVTPAFISRRAATAPRRAMDSGPGRRSGPVAKAPPRRARPAGVADSARPYEALNAEGTEVVGMSRVLPRSCEGRRRQRPTRRPSPFPPIRSSPPWFEPSTGCRARTGLHLAGTRKGS